jgi:hypothetical protein
MRDRTKLHEVDDEFSPERGLQLARLYGPCIRTIMHCREENQEAAHRDETIRRAGDLVRDDHTILWSLRSLDFTHATPSALVMVRPKSPTERYLHALYVASVWVNCVLCAALMKAPNDQQHLFFSNMSGHPATASVAEHVFENIMHAHLTLEAGTAAGFDAQQQPCAIPTTPNLISGSFKALQSAVAPFYWRPGVGRFSGIDSVLGFDDDVWVFQSTVGDTSSSAVDGLEALAQAIGRPPGRRWRLVVVGPTQDMAGSVRAGLEIELREYPQWKDVTTYTYVLAYGVDADVYRSSLERLGIMSEVLSSLSVAPLGTVLIVVLGANRRGRSSG